MATARVMPLWTWGGRYRRRVELGGLALLVGAGAGLGAVGFRYLILGLTRLLTGFDDYAAHPGAAHPGLPGLGRWFVLLTPVLAGLVYGPLVQRFAREARGHGVPEVMLAVARSGGRIRPQVAVVKAVASALCIGGGGSVGREGPIVQIGSALGSSLAQLFRLDEARIRLLVACGAAGGIAATFNAPLAGVFFAMELILRAWTVEAFGLVVVSSVTASVIGRAALGDEPFLRLPAFTVGHLVQYPLFALLGVVAGLVGVGFSRVLYLVEDVCDHVWRGPEWLRPAVGGLLLGGVLVALPQLYGVGYPVLGRAVAGGYAIGFLLVLLVGKMIACSLTIGIGGSGGVFAPGLFCGAMAGAAFGDVVHLVLPGAGGSVGAYALVGMGAVFAGAARAPITAVVIMFELTGEYSIILPLMLAIVLATAVSRLVSADTIYTRKLLRRGIDLDAPAEPELATRPVQMIMGPAPEPVRAGTGLRELADRLATGTTPTVPVVDGDDRLLGVLDTRQVLDALAAGEDSDPLDLCRLVDPLEPDAPVSTAIRLIDDGLGAVPIAQGATLVGWVTQRDVLAAVAEAWRPAAPRDGVRGTAEAVPAHR
ncbi:chloride channel protein [Microlunatus kandeliicorticis]|nr:chloride channel protein [Microlunatus kandeliicorticis]